MSWSAIFQLDHVRWLAVGVLLVALASCVPADRNPPWDTAEMIGELTSELRMFEKLPAEFSEALVLAWRIDTRPASTSTPPIPLPDGSGFMTAPPERIEVAFLWGRIGPESAPSSWALVQGWRRPAQGGPWRRTMINRELSAPLTHLRPGEDADGTWHGYQRYDEPPTSRNACSFAAVDLLTGDSSWQRVTGGFLTRNWTRAFGEAPACRFPDAADVSRK
jgi:hypothetical protein